MIGIKDDLNQAVVLLGLVLLTLVVFVNCLLIVVIFDFGSSSQVVG